MPFPLTPVLTARAEPPGEFLCLRAAPSPSAPALAGIRRDATLRVCRRCGGWFLVQGEGVSGYAPADALTLLYPPGLHFFVQS